MATIHILKPNHEPRASTRPAPHAQSAQILLFTGVRYERWPDRAAVAPKSKKRRRRHIKRDVMTIAV